MADGLLTLAFVAFLVGETIADQQQWVFQQHKHRQIKQGGKPEASFVRTGLFRYSRHPNFFCEQAQWWVVAAFGCVPPRTRSPRRSPERSC